MRLAEYFGYDLSESVNHKVYYRTLQPEKIKRSLRRYDLSYRELSEQTGYTIDCISNSIRMNSKCSVVCLYAVLGVIRHEQEMETFRKENCQRRERRRRNDTTHAKEFLGNLEPSNGACRVTDNVSSARLSGVAGRSGRPDLKGDTRDDECGAYKAPGRLYPDDAELRTEAERIVFDREYFDRSVELAGGWPHIYIVAHEFRASDSLMWSVVTDHVKFVENASTRNSSQLKRIANKYGLSPNTIMKYRRDFSLKLSEMVLMPPVDNFYLMPGYALKNSV